MSPDRGRCGRRGAARPELAPPDRPGRGSRAARPSRAWRSARTATSSRPTTCPSSAREVAAFDKALEEHVVSRGWFAEKPSKVVGRWTGRGVLAIVGGVIALIAGLNIPFSGLTLIGVAAIVGGIVVIGFAQAMPAVTMSGAMIRAMLAAYRRTLQKTMAQARSMEQVVAEAGLDWLDTPDQAVVWGTALGLQSEIEGVLSRSLEDVQEGRTAGALPVLPDLVPELERLVADGLGRRRRQRRKHLLGLRDPRLRRDDVGARDDRQLPVVVGQRRWRWVQRRLVRRRGRRLGRRLLGRSGRLLGAEQVADPVQTLDREGGPRPRAPALGGHPELLGDSRDTLRREAAEARSPRSRGRGTRRSTPRCRGMPRSPRPARRARRRRTQHGGAHLLADAPTLVVAAQPRPGVDRAEGRELLGVRPTGRRSGGRPARP